MDWAAFFDMGGYGRFVWPSYAVFGGTLLWILITPILKKRQLLRALREQEALRKRRENS
ncbi:MAG: heme exporter protein CcmD [Pseudomonadota bacterium]